MAEESPYTERFFEQDLSGSYRSAQRIAPIVCELARPRSLLDVGCGAGAFLKAFSETGIEDFVGVDGDYVPRAKLLMEARRFMAADLTQPLRLGRKFDLVMSLEVAEHLPQPVAPAFVRSLVEHGDVVLFSAAVPGQGGTNHVNEQWPSYWAALFEAHGLRPYDAVRPRIWADDQIEWWYRQNSILFASPERMRELGATATAASAYPGLNLVHPELLRLKQQQCANLTTYMRDLQAKLAAGRQFEVSKLPDGQIVLTKLS